MFIYHLSPKDDLSFLIPTKQTNRPTGVYCSTLKGIKRWCAVLNELHNANDVLYIYKVEYNKFIKYRWGSDNFTDKEYRCGSVLEALITIEYINKGFPNRYPEIVLFEQSSVHKVGKIKWEKLKMGEFGLGTWDITYY